MNKAREGKTFPIEEQTLRTASNNSSGTTQAGRERSEIFKMLREQNNQPRILYPVKLSFKSEGEIQSSRQIKIEKICYQ